MRLPNAPARRGRGPEGTDVITAPDALTIHQLLGRIVYFHALHIAPEQCTDLPPQPGPMCCSHQAAPGRRSAAEVLTDSAWNALVEVPTALPAHHRPCPIVNGRVVLPRGGQ